jgi:hypothetical protein
MILGDVFGLTAGFDGSLQSHSRTVLFDPDAALSGFRCHNVLYRVDRHGPRREGKVNTP